MKTFITIAALALMIVSCAGGSAIRTEEVGEASLLEGVYDVILYETEGAEGEQSVFIILDVEGDTYEFVPDELGSDVKQRERVRSDEALDRVSVLLGQERDRQYRIRRIMNEDVPIGYELIPEDSLPTARPVPNILRIRYTVDSEGKVHLRSKTLPYLKE